MIFNQKKLEKSHCAIRAHPIEDWCPAFHGDALEDCEHGQADVVERGDAVVGALPLLEADGDVGVAGVAAHG